MPHNNGDPVFREHMNEIRSRLDKISEHRGDPPSVLTDGVLVTVRRGFTDDGFSSTHIRAIPLHSDQADYATIGLFYTAIDLMLADDDDSEVVEED